MINFRYHVVSLTAIFLALAIGLVVGTAALNGPVADQLKDRVDAFGKDNSNLRAQVTQYRDELNREEDFAVEAAPSLIGGKLTGRRLLVVVLPSGQEYADDVVKMLALAGAKVTARIAVQDKFFAPESNAELLEVAQTASQPTVKSEGLPLNSDGVETSSALLGLALLERSTVVAPNDLTAVLSAYSKYLTAEDGAVGGAEATIVISGLPPVDRDAEKKNAATLTMATQLAKDKPVVVAGSGVGPGNLVAQLRGDPTLAKRVSTVDNVSTAQGRVVTALATAELMTQAKSGQYGVGAGATSLMPKLPT